MHLTLFLIPLSSSNSMKQRPSWQANRSTASQQIPCILWNQNVITAFTTARHLLLSWASSIQSMPPSHFLKIHFNIILPSTPGSSRWLLPSGFPTKISLLNKPPNFSLVANYVNWLCSYLTGRQPLFSGFWRFSFPFMHYDVWCP